MKKSNSKHLGSGAASEPGVSGRDIFFRDFREILDDLRACRSLGEAQLVLTHAYLQTAAVGVNLDMVDYGLNALKVNGSGLADPQMRGFVTALWIGYCEMLAYGKLRLSSGKIHFVMTSGGTLSRIEIRDPEFMIGEPSGARLSYSFTEYWQRMMNRRGNSGIRDLINRYDY